MLAQLNPTIGDISGNTKKVLDSLEKAKKEGVDIVCFPEMTLCGYAPDDLVLHDSFINEMENALDKVVRASSGITALVGLIRRNPVYEEKTLLISAAVISDGKLLGFHDKRLLPTYDVFNERRYFAHGKSVQVWEIQGKRIGVLICEDMWQHAGYKISGTSYPWDPVKEIAIYKPDILFNLTASPFESRRADARVKMCQAAGKTLKCPIAYCCQVGANGTLIFDGYSLFLDKNAELKKIGRGFEEDYMIVNVDEPMETVTFPDCPEKDVYEGLKLGVSDYFFKSGQKKAVIGISGGLDSALVAAIAVDAIGKENIYGITMPTRFTSKESLEDAEKLTKNLGIDWRLLNIDDTFQHFLNLFASHFQNKHRDITEENVQARIRGMILMSFANEYEALVLATGNKSENALGYCTLYGDMCGALNVIGDILKTDCYELASWINRHKEIIPKRILEKPPSAELKHHQQDTDTLPPYTITDPIIRGYVEDRLPIEKIAEQNDIDIDIVECVIHRIYKAEHKRRQAPPSLRVSKKSFSVGRKKPLHYTGASWEKIY